jgi:hypothetical protein
MNEEVKSTRVQLIERQVEDLKLEAHKIVMQELEDWMRADRERQLDLDRAARRSAAQLTQTIAECEQALDQLEWERDAPRREREHERRQRHLNELDSQWIDKLQDVNDHVALLQLRRSAFERLGL